MLKFYPLNFLKILGIALLFLSLNFLFSFTYAQENKPEGEIQWMEIETAVNRNLNSQKKILIYIYSDNCGWCKKMSEMSFSEPVISQYINEHYYPVKLNASLERPITLGNQTYKRIAADPVNKTTTYHELIVTLLGGRLAYPAIALINEKMEYMGVEFGYRDPRQLEAWLNYISTNEFIKTPDFATYRNTFKGKL